MTGPGGWVADNCSWGAEARLYCWWSSQIAATTAMLQVGNIIIDDQHHIDRQRFQSLRQLVNGDLRR